MKKRFSLAAVMLLLANLTIVAQVKSIKNYKPISGNGGQNIPAELAWITLFTDETQKTPKVIGKLNSELASKWSMFLPEIS